MVYPPKHRKIGELAGCVINFTENIIACAFREAIILNSTTSNPKKVNKLFDQLRDTLRAKHHSYRTGQSYVDWARRSSGALAVNCEASP